MGAKAFISLGEVYEIFIQVTTTDEYSINQRNAVTILDELVKHAMRDNACWEIKVKMDYEDIPKPELQCAGDYLDDDGKCTHPNVTPGLNCIDYPHCMYVVDSHSSTGSAKENV